MPTGSDVRVTFTGDTSQLTAASNKASAAIAATGDAADKAQSKMDALNAESEAVGEKFGKVGGAASKAAGGLSLISPAAGEAAGNLADMADIGELVTEALGAVGASLSTVAAVLAPLAVTVAAATAAYAALANATMTSESAHLDNAAAMVESEAAADKLTAALLRVTEAQAGTSKAYQDNATQIAVLTGAVQQYEVDAAAASKAVQDGVQAERVAMMEALAVAESRLLASQQVLKAENLLAEQHAAAAKQLPELTAEVDRLRAGLTALNETTDAQAGQVAALIIQQGQQAEADKAAAEAARKRAEARAAQAEKERKATEELRLEQEYAEAAAKARAVAEERLKRAIEERQRKEQAYADGIAGLRQIETEANADRLSEMDALTKKRDDDIAALNQSISAQLKAAEGNELKQQEIERAGQAARLAIQQRFERDKGRIIAQNNAKIAEENAAALADLAAKTEARQEKIRDTLRAIAGATVDTLGAMLDYAASRAGEAFTAAQDAATDAASQVTELESLIEGLGLTTVDAAALTGQALVDAYKEGKVAAEDLTETQKRQLAEQLAAEADAARQREGEQRAAALAAWEAQHEAAIATALLQIPLSVATALGSVPFPFNIPLAAAAGALATKAAADVAAQTPPSFRTGYMPDQQLAFIEPQSEIVAPASAVQALGGRDAARDAFAGMSGGGAPTVTRFTMGHREFSALVEGSARRPGPLRDLTVRPSTSYDPHRKR